MEIMKKNIVSLYVDDASVRLLVFQGKRIKKWAELPLDPGLVISNVVMDEAALAAKIKQLFKAQKVGSRKIIVGLSGLHCLTRPLMLPELPKAMLDEAIMREAKRVLPVPLEQLYVSWKVVPAEDGKSQVFLVAVPCKTADPLIRTLRQAGLKPYLMDLKPLALARVVREKTAIVIDVQPTEFDIVIMVDSVPQPIRTVSLPSEALPQKDKWQKVKEELDRTVKFYNSNNPQNQLATDVPILVTGELANRPRLNKTLSEDFGFPVTTLTSPVAPEELDSSRFMVNVGLALRDPVFVDERSAMVMNVNALPVPYQPKPLPLLKLVALPSAVVFIGLAAMLTMFVQDASANVASLRGKLETTNAMITQRQAKQKELKQSITGLQQKLSGMESARDSLTGALTTFEKQHERITGDLRLTTDNVPTTATLYSIGQTADQLNVQGQALDENEVFRYAHSLEPSGRFSEITISAIAASADGNVGFTLSLKTTKGK